MAFASGNDAAFNDATAIIQRLIVEAIGHGH